MSIFGLQILLRSGQMISLAYRTVERAIAAGAWVMKNEKEDPSVIEDEFGGNAAVYRGDICATVVMDESALEELQIERGLAQARAQMKAQKRAQSDPVLNGGVVAARMNDIVMPPVRGRS